MSDNRIYSVIVNKTGCTFFGTFSNRKNLLDSIRLLDLTGAYIQGSTKKLDITPVTIFNGFNGNGLTIYKNNKWFIKVLVHKIDGINPYFDMKENDKQENIF